MVQQTVAVVDDDKRFLEQMRKLLGGAGYAVRTFNSPESALALLGGEQPSAAIIGIRFPNCRPSLDLATAIKLHKATCMLPLILTSTNAARLRVYEQRLHRQGTRLLWFLTRPIDASAMLQLLAEALGQLEREAS